jgi:hypothetical protein
MSLCNGCNGVVGRDCFNPTECEQIAAQLWHHQEYASQASEVEVLQLKRTIDELRVQLGMEPIYNIDNPPPPTERTNSNWVEDDLPF